MNRLYGRVSPSQQFLHHLKWPSVPFGGILAARKYSATHDQPGAEQEQRRKQYRYEIRTFQADKLSSVGQAILTLSQTPKPGLRIRDEVLPEAFNVHDVGVEVKYDTERSRFGAFPVGTKGVFYFRHVRGDSMQSQIRFRLCHTLDEFHHGEDLRGLDGNPWRITLKAMARVPNRYRPVLALLQEEFPIEPRNVDPSHDSNRVISTLDPQKLQFLGQVVSDISGLTSATVHLGDSESLTVSPYYQCLRRGKDLTQTQPYPSETIGVYYYKQSRTASTRLGELRFRLCHDVREFAQGRDLCLLSGDPWCVSSLAIYSRKHYQALRNFLTNEGLLASTFYPGAPFTFPTTQTMPLRVIGDPFVIDLSSIVCSIDIMGDGHTTASRMKLKYMFQNLKNRKQSLISGRAIVQLEEYPGLPPDDEPHGPLLAMRFLEMLTPVKRLSDDDYVQFPQEGELLSRRRRNGEYGPWGLNPAKNREH